MELTPATPRADVAWRHLWFIKNKTVADKYRGRFTSTASLGDSFIPYWNLEQLWKGEEP